MCDTIFCVSASQVEFEQEEYPVREGSPLVEVCVVLVGDPLPSDGLVRLITQDGTAVGEYPTDQWYEKWLKKLWNVPSLSSLVCNY